MFRNRKGMTLVEVILAIALLGMISVSLITGFSSQLININKGTDITVKAMESQAVFEDVIFDVKTQIQGHDPSQSLDPLVSAVPEWSYETVRILGKDFDMQKINKSYSDDVKGNTIYLSRRLAEIEKRARIPIDGVMIDVTTDAANLVADLTSSPLPNLKAVHDDNTNEPGFYVNLYRWWKSVPGKDISSLRFPEDFSVVNVTQTTDILTNLLDNVGAGRFVALTVTPVDIHGFRGNTMVSSNYVFVKGAEWRIGAFPWADTNNDYNLDGNDVRIDTNRIKEVLDAANHSIPNFTNPTEMLTIKNSSLFVPMNIEPGGGLVPGDIPVEISGAEVIDWSVENNINLAKDFNVINGSDVKLTSGTGGNGGSIYLYPYIELDSSGNPVTVNGAPKIINYGSSIVTDGNISFRTLSRGNIELLNNNQLKGNNISLEARGSIAINNSSIDADNDIIFDTMKDPGITGDRSIRLESAFLSSSSPNSKVKFDTTSDILFKGGGWSSNQTIYVPNERNILFAKSDIKVSNSGNIDVGNTGRMYFQHSMAEDLVRSLRVRLEKESSKSFRLTTINYNRNINYASSSNNQKVVLSGLWNRLGSGNHNFEFSTRVISGPGDVDDLAYSYNGNGIIMINVTTSQQRLNTRVKFDVRDRYNTEIVGSGYFVYSVDSSGNPTIEVEEPPALNYYTITFNTNGGSDIAPIGGYAGDSVGTISDPTRIGHTFLGWDKPIPSVIPDYDLEINAIWEAINYKITINSNGGSPINDIYLRYGDQVSIPNPTRTGYTFAGWDTTPPATMPAENLHFVAQWTQNTLTITFDSNGGTAVSPNYKQVLFGSEYGELPTPTRTGYNFDGWYTGRTNGTKVTNLSIVNISDNHTLYARWVASHAPLQWLSINPTNQQNTFTLTFNNRIQSVVNTNLGNVNSFNIDDQTVRYNRGNTSEGSYYVRVRDIHGQELTVNLNLRRTYLWIIPIGWEWSAGVN